MPQTKYIVLSINNQTADLGDIDSLDMTLNYLLEEPENFLTKQGAEAFNITLPCTKLNDQIFNTFHNENVEDLSPGGSFREWMDFTISSNGVIIFKGFCILLNVTITDKPEYYEIMAYGGSGEWLIDMQNMTLWDCLSTAPHTFDVPTVEASWTDFDSDINNDYVYAPLRYRQPFGVNDDKVNIYALRPSISIYWLIQRAFNQIGYTVNSQFLNTADYFRRFVLPWTWGDFYDINSQITDGINFKAAGIIPPVGFPPAGFAAPIGYTEWIFFSGSGLSAHPSYDFDNTGWTPYHISVTAGGLPGVGYVSTVTQTTIGPITLYQNFRLNNVSPPNGFDNFGLYSFNDGTGTMSYTFAPPAVIAPLVGTNVTLRFALSIICKTICQSSPGPVHETVYIAYTVNGGPEVLELIPELSSNVSGQVSGSLEYPTVHQFSIPGINVGDLIDFRIKYDSSGNQANHIAIISSGFMNVNPSNTGANPWQFNPVTQQWANQTYPASTTEWQPMFSSLEMLGLQLQVGGTVNFQDYDAFRNYKFTDMLGGLVELFNLEVQTDPVNKVVTIEPMFGTILPDATVIDGYFLTAKILDWTNKRDFNKVSKMSLFSNMERQLDFTMKQDGSDGGQNIYAARYKGIYLNNVIKPNLNNTNIENGIIAGVPGASRYMLPDRFAKGNRQISNRFFSATMHYNHNKWANIDGAGSPAPQLITIFPENINDSSASAVTQTFEPKIAFYKGQVAIATDGGWYWEGDPNGGGPGIPTYSLPAAAAFLLPKMFSVNYSGAGAADDPVLTYCDQNIGGAQLPGLMSRYYLQRLAIMRNGQLYSPYMRLNLNDICNWFHQEAIKINTSIYALIAIQGYKPFTDDSNECTLWRIVNPMQADVDNSYPSTVSILTFPLSLSTYDLKYAQLLLFQTDIPQIQ